MMTGISCSLFVSVLWLWTLGRADTEVSCVFMESCILPCSFQGGTDAVIHWFLLTAGDLLVHSYYHNQDQLAHQDQHFRKRTSLIKDQLYRGNASLQLTGVEVQDQGRYKCYISTISENKESFINLKVDAPVNKIHSEQVENRITCSSEGIYPVPELTWSTDPPSNIIFNDITTVQQTEQLLYNISSSLILSDDVTDVIYSCTVSTRTSRRRVSLRKLSSISGSRRETSVLCMSSNINNKYLTDFNLVWTFNHSQIILNQINGNQTVSGQWRQHVKSLSESGSLTLQDLSMKQEGIYTCELSSAEETYISSTLMKIQKGGQTSVSGVIIGVVVGVILVAGLASLLTTNVKRTYYRIKNVEETHTRYSLQPTPVTLAPFFHRNLKGSASCLNEHPGHFSVKGHKIPRASDTDALSHPLV